MSALTHALSRQSRIAVDHNGLVRAPLHRSATATRRGRSLAERAPGAGHAPFFWWWSDRIARRTTAHGLIGRRLAHAADVASDPVPMCMTRAACGPSRQRNLNQQPGPTPVHDMAAPGDAGQRRAPDRPVPNRSLQQSWPRALFVFWAPDQQHLWCRSAEPICWPETVGCMFQTGHSQGNA